MRSGDNAADGERTFRLAFPKERAVEFRFASKRRKLIAGIDKIGSHHGYWKGDGDLTRFCNFTTRRIDHDAAGRGICIRYLFRLLFVLRRCCRRQTDCENEDETAKQGETGISPIRRLAHSPIHFHYRSGANSRIRRRSASASCIFPTRRSHCSRSFNATGDSLISRERVCDSIAAAKFARCLSRTPWKNHFAESPGSSSVAMRACSSASFACPKLFRSCAASKCASADLSLIASAARASARARVN